MIDFMKYLCMKLKACKLFLSHHDASATVLRNYVAVNMLTAYESAIKIKTIAKLSEVLIDISRSGLKP